MSNGGRARLHEQSRSLDEEPQQYFLSNKDVMKRYLILALRTPRFDPGVIAPHHEHLARLREQGQLELSGPFTDRSGGAYLVRAADFDAARAIACSDPLHASGASQLTVYEWNAA